MTHITHITLAFAVAALVAATAPSFAQMPGGPCAGGPGWGMGWGNPDAPRGQRFTMLDENRDGVVSMAEIRTNADAVFAAMDSDNSGTLTTAEYMAVRMGPQRGWNQARQAERQKSKEARFAVMDTNHDGTLDKAEFVGGAEARAAKADVNGNGSLERREFRRLNW